MTPVNDTDYASHCRTLLREFANTFVARTAGLPERDPLRELAAAFAGLEGDAVYDGGPELVSRLFTTYLDFAPTFPRELLWFLGGECLHYMPEEEILLHQRLAEEREAAASRGDVLDLETARSRLRGPA